MRDASVSCGLAFEQIDEERCVQQLIDAEQIFRIANGDPSGLLLVVRVLKREVRAFGGCLGMHRR